MDFGKLSDISQVDFSLPPDVEYNQLVFNDLPKSQSARIYVGATGYAMKEWVGTWYSPTCKPNQHLQQYGALFNTIEHNTTYYRLPDIKTVERWYAETPDYFRFCPKVPQTISHDPALGRKNDEVALFCANIAHLKEKLGCCFLQLPPQFGPENLLRLENFLVNWPMASVPLAVEVRHTEYFPKGIKNLLQTLHRYGAQTVITDVAGRRDVCHMGVSGTKMLVRLVGNGMHPTDLTRLDDWMARFEQWAQQGVQEIYLFCHQPDNLLAPDYCREAVLRARKQPHLRAPDVPEPYRPNSAQLSLFDF
jgi:uncharacterized protein YecE (DUF72 family)